MARNARLWTAIVAAGPLLAAPLARGADIGTRSAPGDFVPAALAADPSAGAASDGNGVLEPGETIVLAPSWRNQAANAAVTGTLSAFTGPGQPGAYTITDAAADYGFVAAGATASCLDTGDCYGLSLSATPRPALHWDATAFETLASGSLKWWPVHVGESFADVPRASLFYRFVETLLHHNVTGGCTATEYCPGSATTREQMAAFVLSAHEGRWFTPAGCVEGAATFADVPFSSPFCPWVQELARRGVVSGCAPGSYCPSDPVSREQMAVFTLRTREGNAYAPPACVAGSEAYADVPASSPFCAWIEELTRRGVVTGCGGGNYCPAAPVSRDQMGVFLSGTFALTLYGIEPSFFVVNTADDASDGSCEPSHCSLREAIAAANASPDGRRRDEVRFAIPGAGPHTIRPSALYTLTTPLVLDGYTQPGSSPNTRPAGEGLDTVLRIELDLSLAGVLRVAADSIVRGLALNRGGTGVEFTGERNVLEGCFVGTDPAGVVARGNGDGVVTQQMWSVANRIGGLTPAARNLISGNAGTGVHLFSSNNVVQGNLIGTDRSGTVALANGGEGVHMDAGNHLGSSNENVVGGLERGATNVISGNRRAGVKASAVCCASIGWANDNRIQANVIGRGTNGTPLPNASGVDLHAANASGAPILANTLVGGDTVAPAGNLIASNTGDGVITYGTTNTRIEGNAITENGGHGLYLFEGRVAGNVVGANAGAGARVFLGWTGGSTIRSNAVGANGALGIDIDVAGVTPNDPGDTDGVANFPVLASARSSGGVTVITGIADVAGPVTVDFYASPVADPSGHGEGEMYLGAITVSPNVAFTATLPVGVTPGWVVTATTSYGTTRTSEFSAAIVVAP